MSDAMVSVLDALDDPRALQGIRDEVLEMDLAVKRHMDRGLFPDADHLSSVYGLLQ